MTEHPATRRPRILAARRTPVTARGGRQRQMSADELAARAMRATLRDLSRLRGNDPGNPMPPGERTLTGGWPDGVLLGNCMGPGGNLARLTALRLRDIDPRAITTPATTIDQQCGSGLAAIGAAADALTAGSGELFLAGGAESPSTAPPRIGPDGLPYERAPFAPPGLPDPGMLDAAQALAERAGIPRAAQDAFTARSHRLALTSRARGEHAAELAPSPGDAHHADDDAPRERIERLLGRFPPVLGPGGTLTAGNSSRNADGAAALAIASPVALPPAAPGLAILNVTTTGGDPALPGIAAADAIRAALSRSGTRLREVSAIELVEAFAGQALAVLTTLGLARREHGAHPEIDERVNARGGTLALGHPWGASGAIIATRLFHRLVTSGAPAGARGIAAAAIGGGMGIAMIAEVVR